MYIFEMKDNALKFIFLFKKQELMYLLNGLKRMQTNL